MAEQPVERRLGRRLRGRHGRWLGPLPSPLIGAEQDRLGQVERRKERVDVDPDEAIGQRQLVCVSGIQCEPAAASSDREGRFRRDRRHRAQR